MEYIDRGYVCSWDYTHADFAKDATWHVLDLSSILPEGTKFVRIFLHLDATRRYKAGIFCKNGYAEKTPRGGKNLMDLVTQVANIPITKTDWIEVDENRRIQYYFSKATWNLIGFTVTGWWI